MSLCERTDIDHTHTMMPEDCRWLQCCTLLHEHFIYSEYQKCSSRQKIKPCVLCLGFRIAGCC